MASESLRSGSTGSLYDSDGEKNARRPDRISFYGKLLRRRPKCSCTIREKYLWGDICLSPS